ncbi:MAG TPA: NAD-dependent epimerase/dehydratase family protein [Burkholderiaceae bacterium]|nr:NAD-dependent epimerase/dehydratase family protein [Burkholderiaceae bacterium]
MRILILGGGVFLGAALLDAALARGHALSVFNRGRSRAAWPAGVEALSGDRSGDLSALAGRRFDAVIDTCGYVPAQMDAPLAALRATCDTYLFVSSVSAYADAAQPGTAEDHPLAPFDGLARDDRDLRHYGAQKAACEAEVTRAFGARALIVRPGLIVGPGDRTGRFSYWPWRAAAGGAMLVPDVPAEPGHRALQFIDVRDLAAWMLALVEAGTRGVFNASGPVGGAPISWRTLIDACLGAASARALPVAAPVRVGEAFLLERGVQPWSELPVWLPSIDPAYAGFGRDLSRAAAAGLRTRPLHETIAAVLDEGVPAPDDPRRAGKLTPAREAELLAEWAASPK